MNRTGLVGLAAVLAAGCTPAPRGGETPSQEKRAMKIEHVAFMMADPPAAARWYVQHLGMTVVRGMDREPYTHFLADASGDVTLEIYNNPKAKVPDYASMDILIFHLAFVSADVRRDRDRLVRAGATVVADVGPAPVPGQDEVVTLRDPWGVPFQFARRAKPVLRNQ
jgi:catechol 2,3-dioxygenase-like lactoylglutathione lyase family enzyme